MRRTFAFLAIVVLGPGWLASAQAWSQEPVDFRQDVMAVLSRGGCNQGACHGNLHGKGGFKLSLRGEAPALDLAALTKGQLGRRVNLEHPDESLLLQKASARVPHEGGLRFSTSSTEYGILQRWIEGGAEARP